MADDDLAAAVEAAAATYGIDLSEEEREGYALEAEMTEHVGAAPHERTDARRGHRNGYKPRQL